MSRIDSMIALGEDAYYRKNYPEAIEKFIKSGQDAEKAGLHEQHCLAMYNLGVCYFMILENGEALDNFQQAYSICSANRLGWKMKSRIQNGIAGVYFEEGSYEKAGEIVRECYDEAFSRRDSSFITVYALDLALISNKTKDFSQSESLLDSAQRYSNTLEADISRIRAIKSEAMFMQGKYESVIALAEEQLKDRQASTDDKGIVLIYLINIYTEKRDFQKAYHCAEQAMDMVSLKNKSYLFESLAQLHEAAGNCSQAITCKDSVIFYNDSLMRISKLQAEGNSRVQLEVMRLTAEIDKQTMKIRQSHKVMFLLACILLLLTAIGGIIIYILRARKRQEKQLAERKMKELEMEARYRQEMMRHTLELKQKELSITTMFTSSRNELIEDLLKSLTDIKEIKGMPTLNGQIHHLRQLLKGSKEQDSFFINFETANPDFVRTLRLSHPNLTQSDIRFLAYIRMNMSTKNISTFTNITPESCKRRKIRISQKLGLESSAQLYEYILGI